MTIRHLIATADPARRVPREALQLDVDAILHELVADPDRVPAESTDHRSAPQRRRRLDLALAAVVAVIIAAAAFIPFSSPHDGPAHRSTSSPTDSSTMTTEMRAAANALLDEIRVPASAERISTPPAQYLSEQRTGLACRGTVSAPPRFWFVPDTTLHDVARYLETHRPASATDLNFGHDTSSGTATAFTLYRPTSRSEVVIAIARASDGVGIRADADAAPGSTCLDPRS